MNIVVFINPLQEIHEDWNEVITNMSVDDKAGIEFALQLKEKKGGMVTVVAIGNEFADTALREAFAMGVDHAAMIKDDDLNIEPLAKVVLAFKKINGDIYVSGRHDIVMTQVAQTLNLIQIQSSDINLDNFSTEKPYLVMVSEANYPPRHMSISGVYSAYKKEVKEIKVGLN